MSYSDDQYRAATKAALFALFLLFIVHLATKTDVLYRLIHGLRVGSYCYVRHFVPT